MSHPTALCPIIHDDPRGDTWTPEHAAHASRCPHCRRFLAGVEAMGGRLKDLPRYSAAIPAGLRATLESHLEAATTPPSIPRQIPGSAGRRSFRRWGQALIPVAMAASLVLGVLLDRQGVFRSGQTSGQVARTLGDYILDVTHDHYLFAQLDNSLEVRMNDPAALTRWLEGSLHFSPDLPAGTPDFVLEGGRVWHTVNRLSALAAYATPDGNEAILFAVPAEGLTPGDMGFRIVRGHRVYHGEGWELEALVWIEGDLALALVAPRGHLPATWADLFLRED